MRTVVRFNRFPFPAKMLSISPKPFKMLPRCTTTFNGALMRLFCGTTFIPSKELLSAFLKEKLIIDQTRRLSNLLSNACFRDYSAIQMVKSLTYLVSNKSFFASLAPSTLAPMISHKLSVTVFCHRILKVTNRERPKSAPYPRLKNSKRTSKFRSIGELGLLL